MAAANDLPSPSRNAAASASTPLPSASRVRSADAIADGARSLVTLAGFGLAMMLDTMKTALRQACLANSFTWRAWVMHSASFHVIFRVREYFPYGRKHRFNGNVIGTSVAYRSVAIDAGPLTRALVAWRLQDGGNWIERLPMPGAGWTKDCDRWPTDCCRYMHQPGIICHRNVSHSKSKDRIAQIGSGEAARTASAGRHDRFCDWRFVRSTQNPD